jgi:protein arginine N-methyltransferase 5
MDSASLMGDAMPIFYVGHHETKRALPFSEELAQHAQDLGVCKPICWDLNDTDTRPV